MDRPPDVLRIRCLVLHPPSSMIGYDARSKAGQPVRALMTIHPGLPVQYSLASPGKIRSGPNNDESAIPPRIASAYTLLGEVVDPIIPTR